MRYISDRLIYDNVTNLSTLQYTIIDMGCIV